MGWWRLLRAVRTSFSPWGEGAPKGRMRGPPGHQVAPHQFGRMTYSRAIEVSCLAGNADAAVSHGLTSSPPWGEGRLPSFCGAVIVLTTWLTLSVASAQTPEPLAVEVTNASEPVLCAEKDNVTINLASKDVRRFRIEAAHPAYIGTIQRDSFEADWTGCTAPNDPKAGTSQPPKRTTLYEQIDFWIVGLTFQDFWRPATATVRIGERVEKGIHLLQVWMIRPMGGEEVLVLYPQDGYWRVRPLAPAGLAPTAFGSSFLIGPVEVEGRPIVKLKEVAFEPNTRTFSLAFERGGSATVKMAVTDQNRHTLDVTFDKAIDGRPFAALRSMYVTDFNNDVARIAVREKGAKGWREEPIMAFKRATATDVWMGRVSPSRHNTSSPDMVFGGFAGAK
jgi:hypothetical protein